jgi:signal transduction histidine kinase/ActR/RegA family two-component response regulator
MKIYVKIVFLSILIITAMITSCGNDPDKIYPAQKESLKIEAKGNLLIAMGDYEYPPFEFNDSTGNPSGFNVDIIRSVATVMNLNLQLKLGPWGEVREKLESGKIDILIGMFKTPERDKTVDFTIPHFISTYVIFARDSSDIKTIADIKGRDVIVQNGDLGHDFLMENGTAGKIITKKNLSETLSSLSKGEGDCVIAAHMQGLILIDKMGISNVKTSGNPLVQRNYCIAVKEGDSELLAKLNEGLNIIKTSGEYDRIYEKWFSVYETKRIIHHPYFRILLPVFLILIAVSSGIYFWNIILQKKVIEKTDALNSELENSNKIKNQLQESLAELARSKEEALQSKIDAEKSSEAKSFFLAGVSHELRTPLNGIIGMANLLYSTELTAEQKNLLDMLKASADNLFRLMADLLDFSRVASGKFRFEMAPVNLGEFIVNTSSVVRIPAEEKGLAFKVNNNAPDVTLLIDKERLGQVVFNLAGNAVKYTNMGSVTLDISYDGVLKISVSDTGIGMDHTVIEDIFNPFMQVMTEGAGKNKGLGLGLAIVKLIVETFGGVIQVESVPGEGSRFAVLIPCREVKPEKTGFINSKNILNNSASQSVPSDVEPDNLSVLITEDDQINRVYLERILQKKGWSIDVAVSGDEAVEKTKQKHYDVILMDLNLPGIDGTAATELIRSFEKTHNLKPAVIIAVTAHAYPEDMAMCIDTGMDGYLSKPFSSKKLMDEIRRVLYL